MISEPTPPDESNDALPSDDSAPEIVSKQNQLSIPQEKLSELGIDTLKSGDVFYATARFEVESDDQGNVTGICVQALGHPSDSIPEDDDFVEISSDEDDESEPADKPVSESDENQSDFVGEPEASSEEDEDAKRDKIYGFKTSKTAKKLPKAKDLFLGEG